MGQSDAGGGFPQGWLNSASFGQKVPDCGPESLSLDGKVEDNMRAGSEL